MADFFEDQEVMDGEDDIVTLYNEVSKQDEEFYHLATLDYREKWYVVLKPVQELADIAEDEVLIYELVEDEEGNDNFVPIEDDDTLNAVFAEFEKELSSWEEQQ
jgi:hypothetical protein